MEFKSKLGKEVAQQKYKRNQKQFELNTEIINALDGIENEKSGFNKRIQSVVVETKKKVHKHQQLIKIANKSQSCVKHFKLF
mgnify:CR=1 FL=1